MGSYQHEEIDAKTWERWGVDYLKYDYCGYLEIEKDSEEKTIQEPYIVMRKALDKVNRVNNLISLHKKCFIAVNNPNQDISEFDVKAQKKIVGYRDKLVISHTRNK